MADHLSDLSSAKDSSDENEIELPEQKKIKKIEEKPKTPTKKSVKSKKNNKKEKVNKTNDKKEVKKIQKNHVTTSKSNDVEKIIAFMENQNRPYSIQNIFDNLQGKIKKPILQRLVDDLVLNNQLQAKDFGKSKIYLLNQSNFPEFDQEEANNLDTEINTYKETLNKLKDAKKSKQIEMNKIKSSSN